VFGRVRKYAMMAEKKNALADVVTIDSEVLHGTPCFARTRVPVQTLIKTFCRSWS
jgi:uncharacterized protein (DUF433 family)